MPNSEVSVSKPKLKHASVGKVVFASGSSPVRVNVYASLGVCQTCTHLVTVAVKRERERERDFGLNCNFVVGTEHWNNKLNLHPATSRLFIDEPNMKDLHLMYGSLCTGSPYALLITIF